MGEAISSDSCILITRIALWRCSKARRITFSGKPDWAWIVAQEATSRLKRWHKQRLAPHQYAPKDLGNSYPPTSEKTSSTASVISATSACSRTAAFKLCNDDRTKCLDEKGMTIGYLDNGLNHLLIKDIFTREIGNRVSNQTLCFWRS